MIIEIEYHKGDTLLYGRSCDEHTLKKQLFEIQSTFDVGTDNFIDLLCRRYGYSVLTTRQEPDYSYDRDICRLTRLG